MEAARCLLQLDGQKRPGGKFATERNERFALVSSAGFHVAVLPLPPLWCWGSRTRTLGKDGLSRMDNNGEGRAGGCEERVPPIPGLLRIAVHPSTFTTTTTTTTITPSSRSLPCLQPAWTLRAEPRGRSGGFASNNTKTDRQIACLAQTGTGPPVAGVDLCSTPPGASSGLLLCMNATRRAQALGRMICLGVRYSVGRVGHVVVMPFRAILPLHGSPSCSLAYYAVPHFSVCRSPRGMEWKAEGRRQPDTRCSDTSSRHPLSSLL